MSEPDREGLFKIPEEALKDPEGYVRSKLDEFGANLSRYQVYSEEEPERRRGLLNIDPTYQGLRQRYEQATGDERLGLSVQRRERRREIFTSDDPVRLVEEAKQANQ